MPLDAPVTTAKPRRRTAFVLGGPVRWWVVGDWAPCPRGNAVPGGRVSRGMGAEQRVGLDDGSGDVDDGPLPVRAVRRKSSNASRWPSAAVPGRHASTWMRSARR
jgi:hypothetical protein